MDIVDLFNSRKQDNIKLALDLLNIDYISGYGDITVDFDIVDGLPDAKAIKLINTLNNTLIPIKVNTQELSITDFTFWSDDKNSEMLDQCVMYIEIQKVKRKDINYIKSLIKNKTDATI